jgi:hypothetical protein
VWLSFSSSQTRLNCRRRSFFSLPFCPSSTLETKSAVLLSRSNIQASAKAFRGEEGSIPPSVVNLLLFFFPPLYGALQLSTRSTTVAGTRVRLQDARYRTTRTEGKKENRRRPPHHFPLSALSSSHGSFAHDWLSPASLFGDNLSVGSIPNERMPQTVPCSSRKGELSSRKGRKRTGNARRRS